MDKSADDSTKAKGTQVSMQPHVRYAIVADSFNSFVQHY